MNNNLNDSNMSFSCIINKINSHKIISFDIFGTLLKRNIRHPDDIFILVENEYNRLEKDKIANFPALRKKAEKKSKSLSKDEEITFDSIYKCLPYENPIKERLKQLELLIEENFLTINHAIKKVYDYAVSAKKEIIIVSDMYLPESVLKRILTKFGYTTYRKIYVSSAYGVTKRTGNLFKLLIKENNYIPKDILHIGDAKRSDWLVPIRLGIHTIHIKTYTNKLLYDSKSINYDISYNILSTFINNSSPQNNRYEQLGYEALGPVLVGFCKWLEYNKKVHKIDKLLFLSRDGQIISKAYQQLYPKSLFEYIYTSRRSLVVPLICQQESLESIFDIIPFYRYTSIKALIERLGLEYEKYKSIIVKYGFNEDSSFLKKEYLSNPNFVQLFNELKGDILKNSEEELNGFKKYIIPHLTSTVGIVDIGWKGTMQKTLIKLFDKLDIRSTLQGFYLGLLSNMSNAYGYFFDSYRKNNENLLLSFSGLFEVFFSAAHGSVERYNSDGSIKLYDFEYNLNEKSKTDYKIIQSIQKGALDFVKDYNQSAIKDYIDWNAELAFHRMICLGTDSRKRDLNILGDIYFFDHKILLLAHPSPRIFFNPFKLKKEFSSAPWKIGYLKRLLNIKLPYLTIYKTIKHLYK